MQENIYLFLYFKILNSLALIYPYIIEKTFFLYASQRLIDTSCSKGVRLASEEEGEVTDEVPDVTPDVGDWSCGVE